MLFQERAYGGFRFPLWNPEYLSMQEARGCFCNPGNRVIGYTQHISKMPLVIAILQEL